MRNGGNPEHISGGSQWWAFPALGLHAEMLQPFLPDCPSTWLLVARQCVHHDPNGWPWDECCSALRSAALWDMLCNYFPEPSKNLTISCIIELYGISQWLVQLEKPYGWGCIRDFGFKMFRSGLQALQVSPKISFGMSFGFGYWISCERQPLLHLAFALYVFWVFYGNVVGFMAWWKLHNPSYTKVQPRGLMRTTSDVSAGQPGQFTPWTSAYGRWKSAWGSTPNKSMRWTFRFRHKIWARLMGKHVDRIFSELEGWWWIFSVHFCFKAFHFILNRSNWTNRAKIPNVQKFVNFWRSRIILSVILVRKKRGDV